jgi:hypothetical protein
MLEDAGTNLKLEVSNYFVMLFSNPAFLSDLIYEPSLFEDILEAFILIIPALIIPAVVDLCFWRNIHYK